MRRKAQDAPSAGPPGEQTAPLSADFLLTAQSADNGAEAALLAPPRKTPSGKSRKPAARKPAAREPGTDRASKPKRRVATKPVPALAKAAAPAERNEEAVMRAATPPAPPQLAVFAPLFAPVTRPLPRSRAVAVPRTGLVDKVIGWLAGLMPRQKRAPLPRVRTRLPTAGPACSRSPEVVVPPPAPPAPTVAAGDDSLSRRMLVALSEENLRLRRELEELRAARG